MGLAVLLVLIGLASVSGEVSPAAFFANIHRLPAYIWNILPPLSFANLHGDLAEWFWNLKEWFKLLVDTLLIAYLGTLLGALGAFLLCFFASANLERRAWIRIICRRYLEFCRTVPEIVFALIVRRGVRPRSDARRDGLGHSYRGRARQAVRRGGREHRHEAGGRRDRDRPDWVSMVRYAVLPQVMSNFASYALLRFEINVRGAAVMGFVGAGGIGQDLMEAIRKFYYTDVSAILVLIVATVMVIDLATERLRHALIGLEHRP